MGFWGKGKKFPIINLFDNSYMREAFETPFSTWVNVLEESGALESRSSQFACGVMEFILVVKDSEVSCPTKLPSGGVLCLRILDVEEQGWAPNSTHLTENECEPGFLPPLEIRGWMGSMRVPTVLPLHVRSRTCLEEKAENGQGPLSSDPALGPHGHTAAW